MPSDRPTSTRRRVLLGIGTGATVGLAGCSGDGGGGGTDAPTETPTDTPMETQTETETPEETPSETAAVRIAHLSPDAPNVDVYVEGDTVLEDVAFGAVSDYLDVPAGERSVEITAAGDPDAAVFSGPVQVEAETAYTIAAVGELADDGDQPFEPLVLEDDNSDPGAETARVRVVHASPDAPAVDVTVESTGDALFDGVAYGESGDVEVPAGEYTVQIRGDTESNDGDVVADFDLDLAGGGVYTAFAAGYLSPDDEPADTPFDLIVAQDAGGDGGADPANVRVAHLSPDAPNVDVYVEGDAVLEDVPFGAVSDYLDVPAGSRAVEITAAGDPDASVFAGDVDVAAGDAYTIAAVGELADDGDQPFEPLVLEDDISTPDAETARLRVVHASPDAPAVDVTVESTGDALFDGVAYGESGYTEVPAGEYVAQIRGDTENNDGDVVADFDLALSGEAVYTAFAAGYLTPDDEPADTPFDLIVAQDAGAML
ncbi:DUF4397 domain-containing protein [Halobellus ordinarius]|uniref:DUF4397 domain-containing protein n=1 Tax=Halobellus ordinarius TaxID=3075120 RepID=UPI00288064BC|nr:DUF4397 domain-containing protein [Halobellus sp. ZY16]